MLLCNDSVIGPFFDLKAVVLKMIDLAGSCLGIDRKLFVFATLAKLFSADAVRGGDTSFREFFDSVVPQPSRHDVIRNYELGFSRLIKGLGFYWKAFAASR